MLVDDDLRLEDGPAAPRPAVMVNRWLRELPASGAPAPSSWENYARAVKEWAEFLAGHGVGLVDSRERLKSGLSRYAEHRAAGPVTARFAATTWGQHMSILSLFYRWAIAEGYAAAEPFTYRSARALFAGTGRGIRVNLAVRRIPKPHVTIKYLEPDFTELFRKGLRGLAPDGSRDCGFAGRELARNAAIGDLALSTGLRLAEFTHLLPWEIPALPPSPTIVPIPFPVPGGITKGRKHRTTWTSYEALAGLHDYLQLDRAAAAAGSGWRPPRRWGEPLLVTEPDARGGRVNGIRRPWATLTPAERRRLVAPDGGACLLAVKNGGGPFTAWATVFERTSDRLRARFEPRFPHVNPHRLRHSFSMRTQVSGVASAASFGSSREHALPAAQRAALQRARRAGAPGGCGDQGFHGPPGSDATMMRLRPLRGVYHRCVFWDHDALGSSRLHRVHHRRSRSAAPGRHRSREGRAEPSHHWSRHPPDLAPAALVAPGASRVPGPEVPAAASSPVSSAARRRAAVPQTRPARIAHLGRWRLLTWPWSTAGIHTRNHRSGSSLQAPGSS